MKVLFVSSGNTKNGISPIVKAQAESLIENGVNIEYFTINGTGLKGYIANIKPLRTKLRKSKIDIIHSHYSLSSFVVSLANIGLKIPQISSLMGSDVNAKGILKFSIKIFNDLFWKSVIVKSEDMRNKVSINKNIYVIPNGVNLQQFSYLEKEKAQEMVEFDESQKNIIWVSNPERYEKNFQLANKALEIIAKENIKLNVINSVPHGEIYKFMYAADLLLLTSRWEGSPNVVKEAMACNLPVVSTDVGDIKWLFGNEPGYFLTDNDSHNVARNIKKALEYADNNSWTKGRSKILELGLDSSSIAKKIVGIYRTVYTIHNKQVSLTEREL